MREFTTLFMSVALHMGVALAAWQAGQYFNWKGPEKQAKVYEMELISSRVNKVVPLKKQPPVPKKKKLVKKQKPKKAARKKKLVTQKQKSPVKIKQSLPQKQSVASRKKLPAKNVGPKGSSNPLAPEDGRLLRQRSGNIPPQYPVADRLRRNTGKVTVVGYVDKLGKVSQVRIGNSTGTPSMEENARQAFTNYRFQKGQQGWVKMPYEFVLGGEAKVLSTRDRALFE